MRTCQVLGDDSCGEAVVGVIGTADHFRFVVKDQDAHHRAEDFLTHDAHLIPAVTEHGRRDIGTLGVFAFGHPRAAAEHPRTLGTARLDVIEHAVHVCVAHQRAEVGSLVQRITQADTLDPLEHLGFEPRLQRTWDEHAGAVGAHLAGAEEVGHDRDVCRTVEIGVFEDDQRRLAAQLHGHVLE